MRNTLVIVRNTPRSRAVSQHVTDIQEQERRRIARDIHDHIGQQLTALRLGLESLRMMAWPMPALAQQAAKLEEAARDLDRAIEYMTWNLRPEPLEHAGLSVALQQLVGEWSERFRIAGEFASSDVEGLRIAPGVELNLYRMVQEALQNVYKHAAATHVGVVLERRGDVIQLVVEDNGRGMVRERHERPAPGSFGFAGMRERAAMLGGELEVESTPGRGTTVYVRIPVESVERDG